MAETTLISWADATLNFWIGCTEVSNGEKGACKFCYARTWAERFPHTRGRWGAGAPRLQTQHVLSKAKAIVRKGQKEGRRQFVFSNSLGDIFDKEVPIEWLVQALQVAAATPENIYLFLTKRAPMILKRLTKALELAGMERLPPNIAFGITVVTQEEADQQVPWLLAAKEALRPIFVFLSMEPLMGPVDLTRIELGVRETAGYGPKRVYWDALTGWEHQCAPDRRLGPGDHGRIATSNPLRRVDWVIVGGESGLRARPSDPQWFYDLRDQCLAAGVPFHFKQWGEWLGGVVYSEGDRGGFAKHEDGLQHGGKRSHWWAGDVWSGRISTKVGKKADPGTLGGKLYRARPQVAEAA